MRRRCGGHGHPVAPVTRERVVGAGVQHAVVGHVGHAVSTGPAPCVSHCASVHTLSIQGTWRHAGLIHHSWLHGGGSGHQLRLSVAAHAGLEGGAGGGQRQALALGIHWHKLKLGPCVEASTLQPHSPLAHTGLDRSDYTG